MKKIILLFILFLSSNIHAQELILTSANNLETSNGSVSYSVGQTFVNYISTEKYSISEGVQQVFEISEISGLKENNFHLECSIYPNPTTDFINISITNTELLGLKYQIIDLNGRNILETKIIEPITTIDVKDLKKTTYFFIISIKNKIVKTFKITKL